MPENTPVYNKEEVAREAMRVVKNTEEKHKKKIEWLIENYALVLTYLTIGLLSTLYSFKLGYLRVFNIPGEYISVSLYEYIPLAIQIFGVYIYITMYIALFKTDETLNRFVYNPLRAMYGGFVLLSLSISNFGSLAPEWVYWIISMALSFAFEFLVYRLRNINNPKQKKSNKKKKLIDEYRAEMYFEDKLVDYYRGKYYVKCWIGIIIIAVLFSPFLGRLKANANRDFQIFTIENQEYAVIIDRGEYVIAEEATIESCKLHVNNEKYLYLNKEGLTFRFMNFEEVYIGEENNHA